MNAGVLTTRPSISPRRGQLPCAALALLSVFLVIDVASAELRTDVGSLMEVVTLSTQAHPREVELAWMVMEAFEIGGASLEYRLDRWNFGPEELRSGGQMAATLKVITAGEAQKVGQRKSRCVSDVFEDERGSFNQRVCRLYWEDQRLDVKPGDVVVWKIKFKKMPRLEYESWDDTVYRDRFTLAGMLHPAD